MGGTPRRRLAGPQGLHRRPDAAGRFGNLDQIPGPDGGRQQAVRRPVPPGNPGGGSGVVRGQRVGREPRGGPGGGLLHRPGDPRVGPERGFPEQDLLQQQPPDQSGGETDLYGNGLGLKRHQVPLRETERSPRLRNRFRRCCLGRGCMDPDDRGPRGCEYCGRPVYPPAYRNRPRGTGAGLAAGKGVHPGQQAAGGFGGLAGNRPRKQSNRAGPYYRHLVGPAGQRRCFP